MNKKEIFHSIYIFYFLRRIWRVQSSIYTKRMSRKNLNQSQNNIRKPFTLFVRTKMDVIFFSDTPKYICPLFHVWCKNIELCEFCLDYLFFCFCKRDLLLIMLSLTCIYFAVYIKEYYFMI